MKKIYQKISAILLLIGVIFSMFGCANRAPKLEEIYDRAVELIENSYELNEIFFGAGLPYCDRNLPVYQSLYSDYTTIGYTSDYNIVSRNAGYQSVEELKIAAEKVYSKALLESSVYPAMFDGLMQQNVATGSTYLQARYIEDNQNFYVLIEDPSTYHATPLIYDYSTMEIIRPSNASQVQLSIVAWEENSPNNPFQMRLSLVKENGVWLLDKLTV